MQKMTQHIILPAFQTSYAKRANSVQTTTSTLCKKIPKIKYLSSWTKPISILWSWIGKLVKKPNRRRKNMVWDWIILTEFQLKAMKRRDISHHTLSNHNGSNWTLLLKYCQRQELISRSSSSQFNQVCSITSSNQ